MNRLGGEYRAPVPFAGTGELISPTGERLSVPPDLGGTTFVSIVNRYSSSVLPLEAHSLGEYIEGNSGFQLAGEDGNYWVEPPAQRMKNAVTFRGFRTHDGRLDPNTSVPYIDPVATLFVQWLHGMPFNEEQADQVELAYQTHLGMGIILSPDRTGIVFPEGPRLEVVTVFDSREKEEEPEFRDGGIDPDLIGSSTPSRSSEDILPSSHTIRLGEKYRNAL